MEEFTQKLNDLFYIHKQMADDQVSVIKLVLIAIVMPQRLKLGHTWDSIHRPPGYVIAALLIELLSSVNDQLSS